MKAKSISLVIRHFQPGTNLDTYDKNKLLEKVFNPLSKLLKGSNQLIDQVIILVNADGDNIFSEQLKDGVSPTEFYINECLLGCDLGIKIQAKSIDTWGKHLISTRVLNETLDQLETSYVMMWSPELSVISDQLVNAFDWMKDKRLQMVGFLRQGYQSNMPWQIPQNTGSIIDLETFKRVGGFDAICDQVPGVIFDIDGQSVHCAGMEDFYWMLKCYQQLEDFSWGMFGINNISDWKYEDNLRNRQKIARQIMVMQYYYDECYPDVLPNKSLSDLIQLGLKQ